MGGQHWPGPQHVHWEALSPAQAVAPPRCSELGHGSGSKGRREVREEEAGRAWRLCFPLTISSWIPSD